MDSTELAGQAVALIAAHLRRITGKVANKTSDRLAEFVYERVERKLGRSADGRAALLDLQADPGSEAQKRALEAVLREAISKDRDFAKALRTSMNRGSQVTSNLSQQTTTADSNQLVVGRMNRSQVAYGPMTVDRSRHIRISVGLVSILGLLGLLVLVVLLAAFASDSSGDRDTSGESGSGVDFTAPNTLVLLDCSSTGNGTVRLTLSAVSAENGELLGTRFVTLPSEVRVTDDPCADTPLRRQRFNEDFSQVAVTLPGPNGEGRRAVAVDIESGQILGPAPDPDAFAASPHESSPIFDSATGHIWYIATDTEHLLSRPVDAAPTDATDHGAVGDANGVALVDGGAWIAGTFDTANSLTVNPGGTYAAFTYSGDMFLWQKGTNETAAASFPGQDSLISTSELAGTAVPQASEPEFWLDDYNLVCSGRQDGQNNYFKITLSQDYLSVAAVLPLLPATDRQNATPLLSPDHRTMTFMSTQGGTQAIYQQDLTTSTSPVKIADLQPGQMLVSWE